MHMIHALRGRWLPTRHVACLHRWAGYIGALSVLAFGLAYVPGFAVPGQRAFGLGAVLVASLLLVLYGQLAILVQVMGVRLGSRGWLIHGAAYLGCSVLVGAGVHYMPIVATNEAGLVIGLSLLLAACMAVLCLGAAVTLVRSHSERDARPSLPT